MTETTIMRQIQIAVSRIGARLFRNNTGMVRQTDGRIVRFGLAVGSSDLIGFKTVDITPEMVGHTIAIFTAVEVKTPKGRITPAQQAFLVAVQSAGGIGIVARSVEEALEGIK